MIIMGKAIHRKYTKAVMWCVIFVSIIILGLALLII